jgi:hypothetical protein
MRHTQICVLAVLLGLILSGCNCNNGAGGLRDDSGRLIGDGGISDLGTSDHVKVCPGCPCFPGSNCMGVMTAGDGGSQPPPACTSQGATPSLVYPPDQALFPPNTNVIEVQFQPGQGNTLFEIDFANKSTNVRFITQCNAITNTRGVATPGCGFTLDMNDWQSVAAVNRGGDPVHVTVRATPNGSCIATSASRDILFASEDLNGAIYYWQSVTVGGVPGKAGGIYRYDFGRADIAPEAFLESSPTTNNRCIGCHFLSRDGLRITYGTDDPDSDDEFHDVTSSLMEVATRNLITNQITPGFRTFNKDHQWMLASDGRGAMNGGMAFIRYDMNGTVVDSAPTGNRSTQPDWSPDDSRIIFVQPTDFLANARAGTPDDQHFFGGSLFTMSWDGSRFGPPMPFLMSTGENNYYPAYSPDGQFIVFNRVLGVTGLAGDAFANPAARVFVMPAQGGTPVDLARLNAGDGLGNSWPRWSPFVQHDRGHSIIWVTFSSNRDYGFRVQNEDPAGVSCYPPDSPENLNTGHQCPLVPAMCTMAGCVAASSCPQFCRQPQIWMSAVEVDSTGGISAGKDTSHPAFWLPFQEISAHNHVPQWVSMVPPSADAGLPDACTSPEGPAGCLSGDGGPGQDAGACGVSGSPCGNGQPLCCASLSCLGGMCSSL